MRLSLEAAWVGIDKVYRVEDSKCRIEGYVGFRPGCFCEFRRCRSGLRISGSGIGGLNFLELTGR